MFQTILKASNTEVQGNFVEKPGVILLNDGTGFTPDFYTLRNYLGYNEDVPDNIAFTDISNRITFMQHFDTRNLDTCLSYLNKIISLGHLSSFNHAGPTILIAGCSTEASLELVSHHEFQVSRWTSSKTKTMSNPMYTLPQGQDKEIVRDALTKLDALAKSHDVNNMEYRNRLFSGYKSTCLIMSAGYKDWHKLLIGRFESSNELEIINLMSQIRAALSTSQAVTGLNLIWPEEDYRKGNNGDKIKKCK